MQRVQIITGRSRSEAPGHELLVRSGFPVQICGQSRQELLEALSPRPPDVVILDGETVDLAPREVRELLQVECPEREICLIQIIDRARITTFDPAGGPDDFVLAPVDPQEILARVRLYLWRVHRVESGDMVVAGELVIDQANYTVAIGDETLSLTFKEYELLRFLVTHRGRVFTREALLNQVWGYDYYGGIRTVDVHIRRIRAKLGTGREDLVETIRNVGYRFSG